MEKRILELKKELEELESKKDETIYYLAETLKRKIRVILVVENERVKLLIKGEVVNSYSKEIAKKRFKVIGISKSKFIPTVTKTTVKSTVTTSKPTTIPTSKKYAKKYANKIAKVSNFIPNTNTALLKAFNNKLIIGEFPIIASSNNIITIATKARNISFNKSTGIEVNPKNASFPSRIAI